jgi:hypothetical protein
MGTVLTRPPRHCTGIAATVLYAVLALTACTSPPSTGQPTSTTGSSASPTAVPERWAFEADPNSAYGLPKPVGLAPEVKPATRVLSDAEAKAVTGVEIINKDVCQHRSTLEPKCRYRIALASVPADVTPGRVLVSGVSPAAPAGFLITVDAIEGTTVLATEAGLGDALAQGEFRGERAFTPTQITSSSLTSGVTRLPGPGPATSSLPGTGPTSSGGKGTAVRVGPSLSTALLGEGMDFHYGVDVTPTPGIHIVGEVHFSAGCGVDGGLTYWHGIPDGAWFDASCHLRQGAKFDLSVSAPAGGTTSHQLAKEVMDVIYFQVGPVPVIIVPELVVSVTTEGQLSVGVSFGAQESIDASIGIGYHGEFQPYARFDADSDSHHQLPTGPVDSTVGGNIAVRMMLYGVLGPEISGLGHVKFTGGPDQSPKVCYAIRAAVGASVVLDFVIKSWDWGPYLFIDKTFKQGCRVNTPPVVTITWPTEGASIPLGSVLLPQLSATATDADDGTLKTGWSSNVDGYLGVASGPLQAGGLKTPGAHTLTASTTDSDGASASAQVHVSIVAPTLTMTTVVTDLGGQAVTLVGGRLTGAQGAAYLVVAKPRAPANLAQPACTSVTWAASIPLEDRGNCLARIELPSQGTYAVTATLANPYGAPVAVTIPVTVGPPPVAVTPVFEGITVTSAARGVLLDGGSFGSGEQLTLRMRYLNEAQTGVEASYAWSVRMDGGAWTDLTTTVRDAAGVSTRTFSNVGYKTNHTFTFRCIVTGSGGQMLTTRALTLAFIAAPA